jgi:hypothetical protein
MGNKNHWADGLTKLEIAEQLIPVLVDMIDGHDDGDDNNTLEAIQVFVDKCLDESIHSELMTIRVLNQYVVPFWHRIDIPLMPAHVELIHSYVDDWVCEYHEKERSD